MKFSYHITFGNGSNPYYGFLNDKIKIKKAVCKWLNQPNFWNDNLIEIFSENHKYRIDNRAEETWTIWKNRNGFYVSIAEYYKLENAFKRIEKRT